VIAGTNMVATSRRAREVISFIRIHSPAHLQILHSDPNAIRDELVRTSGGLIVAAVAGVLFLSFVSVALLVSAWESRFRLITAWGISAGWLVIALAGLVCARRAEGADFLCGLASASAARPRGDERTDP